MKTKVRSSHGHPASAAKAVEKVQRTDQTQCVFNTKKLLRYQFPTHITDLVVDRAQSACSEVFVVVVPPKHSTPAHKHDDWEQIFYILAGRGTLMIGKAKQQFAVKTGDVVRIPLNTLHSIKAEGKTDLRYLCVDCFGSRDTKAEPTWHEHIRIYCGEQGLDINNVVKPGIHLDAARTIRAL